MSLNRNCWNVRPLYVHPNFRFRMITSVNVNGLSPNTVCALLLWRSGLGLLMGKFHQFLTELSAHNIYIFSLPVDNFSKYQWIFTKFGVCIDNVETWFRIPDGQISSILIRPFEKRDILCYGVWRSSVHPSVCKLFRFRLTPPTVYIRSSWNLVYS